MHRPTWLTIALLLTSVSPMSAASTYSWTYYRPTNTGIQGDWCDSLRIDTDGDPWIGGYDPSFEEGGISKFIQAENRWLNVSNVDYPVIGHPDLTGITRIGDIDADASGKLWMATGRGGLSMNPRIGAKTLKRYGADNSGIPGGWNKEVEAAPDGTVWFSSYSTSWGGGGLARYNPSTAQWTVFEQYGGGPLALQPLPAGGYYVWTTSGVDIVRFSSTTGTWKAFPRVDGNPAFLPGKNATDSAGNTWMYRWTNAEMYEMVLDRRKPDGTWANIPSAPFDVQFNSARVIRAKTPLRTVIVDGGGTVYRFNGKAWINLGMWNVTTESEDVDIDAQGNVWACGAGGAARRDALTGTWQRYRITNTSQFDMFTYDLSLDPGGGIYATANAAAGYGGMVRFDGTRWIGFNNYHYGLGHDWPFPTDNSTSVHVRPSNGRIVVNPMFNYLHDFDGIGWTSLDSPADSVDDVIEDSLGRLWITYYGGLAIRDGSGWKLVSSEARGKLVKDPNLPGTVWAMGDTTFLRTNGSTFYKRTIASFPGLDPNSDQFKGLAVDKNGIVWVGANTINLPQNSALIRLDPATGTTRIYRNRTGWRFPGQYVMPLAATPDGKVWMQYDSDYLVAQRGLFWFDGTYQKKFPAPSGGEPQWGGLPHAGIADLEVRTLPDGYELWMSCLSRGIAVLKVKN